MRPEFNLTGRKVENTIPSMGISDFVTQNDIVNISPIIVSKPNDYKGVIFTFEKKGESFEQFITLTKRASEAATAGSRIDATWSVYIVKNSNGEKRFKLSNSTTTSELF